MIFGNTEKFAIECESSGFIHEMPCGIFRLWIAGAAIGDDSSVDVLSIPIRVVDASFRQSPTSRTARELYEMEPDLALDVVRAALFDRAVKQFPASIRIRLREKYSPYVVSPCHAEMLDGHVEAIAIPYKGGVRFVWRPCLAATDEESHALAHDILREDYEAVLDDCLRWYRQRQGEL